MKVYHVPFEFAMSSMPDIEVRASSLKAAIRKAEKLHSERNLELMCALLSKFDDMVVWCDYDGDDAEEIS